ncbi:MAG TPA: hypothetical protein VK399_15785, partial [Longimicrobiaceae bacterium]|nr:hypothetical protein [Longimicrobiaceae bacterium]
MSFGITGGFAFTIQTPLGSLDGTSQEVVKTTGMPYLMALPGYWGASEATRAYCAASWGSGDENTAAKAASAVAHKRAELLFETIVDAFESGADETKPALKQTLKD